MSATALFSESKSYTVTWLQLEHLKFIHSLKSARVTGSFGAGIPGNNSDLDVKINENDLQKYKAFLRSAGIEWDSEIPGHITADGVEVFSGFTRRKGRLDSVTINGLTFKTW